MRKVVDLEITRRDLRHNFALWDIDSSEYEILWEEERSGDKAVRKPGVKVRYLRNGQWQEIACYDFPSRAQNLRQVLLLIQRLRIAEQSGVQYSGLSFVKDVVATQPNTERSRKEALMDAYDILGVSPDDPVELVKKSYTTKASFYHPDHGGNAEKFKRLTEAYNLILESRGAR